MIPLLRRMLNYDTVDQLVDVAHQQSALIDKLLEGYAQFQLQKAREHRDLIAAFLVELDKPEDHDELRDRLHAALIDRADEVARLEEHSTR